jgi:hypothetical protein
MTMQIETEATGLRVVLVAGLAALALLAAGCGGGSAAPSVASVGTTGATSTSASGTSSAGGGNSARSGSRTGGLAFSACMRSHGVPSFPDPSSKGTLPSLGIDRSSPQFRTAAKACHSLAPTHSAAQVKQHVKVLLAVVRCMRSHGVPYFPDPNSQGSIVAGPGTGWDPSSPKFQAAQKACASLNPGTG